MFLFRRAWNLLCRLILLLALAAFSGGLVIMGLHFPFYALVAVAVARLQAGRRVRPSDAHGTARMSNVLDLANSHTLGDDGVILGRVGWAERPGLMASVSSLLSPCIRSDIACGLVWAALFKSRWLSNRMIRINDYCHLATFSRTGGGKGVSVIVPTLRSYRRSIVTTDPDGQNFHLSWKFRKRMGHEIVCLDPNHRCGPRSARFNPLAFIKRKAADVLDQCREVAGLIIVKDERDSNPYWNDQAENVLTAVIAFVVLCAPRKERNLDTVREILSSRDMFANLVTTLRQAKHRVLRRAGGLLSWLQDKELNGVINSVGRHMAWIDSPEVAACLKGNSFDPRKLKTGKMTVYLVLPGTRLVSLAPLMRLWIGSLLRLAQEDGPNEANEILFVLDEAAHLGHIQALETAVTTIRKYGVRLWFIFQSINQVKEVYGKAADTVLGNIATLQFFNLMCFDTCETVSRWIGTETRRQVLPNNSTSTTQQTGSPRTASSISKSSSRGLTTTELGRRVLMPEEIRVLPEDVALVFHNKLPVIPAKLLRYYDAPEFKGRRTGKQRGIGLAAGIKAVLMLVISVGFVSFARSLPVQQIRPWTPARPYWAVPGRGYGPQPWQLGSGAPLPSYRPDSYPQRQSPVYRTTTPSRRPPSRGRTQQRPSDVNESFRVR